MDFIICLSFVFSFFSVCEHQKQKFRKDKKHKGLKKFSSKEEEEFLNYKKNFVEYNFYFSQNMFFLCSL